MGSGGLILAAGALLAAALVASLLAGRLRVPGLVLFLGLGMAIGADGTGWIHFDDYQLAQNIGIVALALILFEGGLSAGWDEIRPVLWPSISLALVGTLATALVMGAAASLLFGFSPLESMLLGSIVAATDGAAIFSLLRGSTLRRRLARTLEGEAGMNDPIAVLLVIGFIDWIQDPGYGVLNMVGLFVLEISVGVVVGLTIGLVAVRALERVRLASAGLYPVASIAAAALAFGLADVVQGSGFLAVYLTGLVIGSSHVPAKRTIVSFHDGLAWIAQLTMFLALGLLVFPSQLGDFVLEGTALALVLVFLARPLATLVATAPFSFSWPDRTILGWAGLRGAVPVVLATFPVIAGIGESQEFFNIVFFAVIFSTLLQGSTFEPLAKRLGVTTDEAALPRPLVDTATIKRLGAEVVEFPVDPTDAIVGLRIRELGLPREALLNVIVRGEQALPPRGSSRIHAGDRLHILVRQEVAIEFRQMMELWRVGPVGKPPRPPRVPRGYGAIYTSRPWRQNDGDAARPAQVNGIAVVEQLRTRRDGVAGALCALEDGRFAVTGPIVLVGSAGALQARARKRIAGMSEDDDEAGWWQEVVGALAGERRV